MVPPPGEIPSLSFSFHFCVYIILSFFLVWKPSHPLHSTLNSPPPLTLTLDEDCWAQHAYSSGWSWLTPIEFSCESNQQLHITNVQLSTLKREEWNKASAGATPSIYPSLWLQLLTTFARHFCVCGLLSRHPSTTCISDPGFLVGSLNVMSGCC